MQHRVHGPGRKTQCEHTLVAILTALQFVRSELWLEVLMGFLGIHVGKLALVVGGGSRAGTGSRPTPIPDPKGRGTAVACSSSVWQGMLIPSAVAVASDIDNVP